MRCETKGVEVTPKVFSNPNDYEDTVLRCPACGEWTTEDMIPVAEGDLPEWCSAEAWEAFNAVGASEFAPVVVRPLDNTQGRYSWPDNEITNGIAYIELHLSGDSPHDAFLRVAGPDHARVIEAFTKARRLVIEGKTSALFAMGEPVPHPCYVFKGATCSNPDCALPVGCLANTAEGSLLCSIPFEEPSS